MKRINEYRKLLEVSQETDLSGLKSTYRSLMKEWHPDKFANDEAAKEEAEHKSKKIIEAYHFLVSIAPETQESNLEIYNQTINESGIVDFWHKGQTLTVNFQDGSVAGKIQFGSGWWFLDQKHGMEMQLDALSATGLLSRFVGMLTDSRSFLSYPRHEYFRRILCRLLGEWVEDCRFPQDYDILGEIVRGISCDNARKYFAFPTK